MKTVFLCILFMIIGFFFGYFKGELICKTNLVNDLHNKMIKVIKNYSIMRNQLRVWEKNNE